jgi:hypothetical protein
MRERRSGRINLAPERLAEWFSHGLGRMKPFDDRQTDDRFWHECEVTSGANNRRFQVESKPSHRSL